MPTSPLSAGHIWLEAVQVLGMLPQLSEFLRARSCVWKALFPWPSITFGSYGLSTFPST